MEGEWSQPRQKQASGGALEVRPEGRSCRAGEKPSLCRQYLRGADRNRTGVHGFAGRCVATPPRRRGGARRVQAARASSARRSIPRGVTKLLQCGSEPVVRFVSATVPATGGAALESRRPRWHDSACARCGARSPRPGRRHPRCTSTTARRASRRRASTRRAGARVSTSGEPRDRSLG
jgi:hypothetical protein